MPVKFPASGGGAAASWGSSEELSGVSVLNR